MNKKLDLDQSKLLGFKMLNKASDDQPHRSANWKTH